MTVNHIVNILFLSLRVFVADSLIKGAGQGLFAKTDVETDTVMAFYNGVRITHTEVLHTGQVKKEIILSFSNSQIGLLVPQGVFLQLLGYTWKDSGVAKLI